MWDKVAFTLFPAVLESFFAVFNEPTAVYFRATREKIFGKKLEQIWGDAEGVKKAREDTKNALAWVDALIKENGESALFLMGDAPVDADFAIASVFKWISTANAQEWEALKGLNDGRWVRFMDTMRQYEEV